MTALAFRLSGYSEMGIFWWQYPSSACQLPGIQSRGAQEITVTPRFASKPGLMKREEFAAFVGRTIEEVICLAEEKSGKTLQHKYSFSWLGRSHPTVSDNVVEHIAERVFVDEEHI